VFSQFAGRAVSVVGEIKKDGEWFGDIQSRCQRYKVPAVPVFVGAVYYLERGQTASRVFETARKIEREYDDAGFIRLRGVPNEEPLISLGMAKEGCQPVLDNGDIKADAMSWTKVEMNLLKGEVQVTCPDKRLVFPALLHFNCSYSEKPPYTNSVLSLELFSLCRWPKLPAEIAGTLVYLFPYLLRQTLLNIFRPLYRRAFGFREIKKSARMPN
jgi:hypothetical protein